MGKNEETRQAKTKVTINIEETGQKFELESCYAAPIIKLISEFDELQGIDNVQETNEEYFHMQDAIEYPKRFMRRKELLNMGFTNTFLERAIRMPGQKFVCKLDPTKKKSYYIFDTEKFEKWRLKDIKTQNDVKQQRITIA